jgi:phage-related protein
MPRGAAELVVQFVADTTKLRAEVSKVESTGSKLKSFGKKAALGIGGAFAVGKVVDFGKASLTAAQESEQATGRLSQVFKSMGDSTGSAAKAAENYASKLSAQIGVEDESIMAAQAKLATFKDVSSETARQSGIFDRATAAAADLAAAGFGTLDSNAAQLGKALQDPVKGLNALARSGVTFTAQQKDQIKAMVQSGDVLGAQKVVLGAVEGQVKGTAAATATESQKMSVAFGEVEEQVGTALMPAFKGLSDILLSTVVPALQATIGFISENATWLAPLAAAVLTLVVGLKAWAIAQAAVNVVMAANPIVLVVVAIAALVAAIVIAYQKVGWFRAGVDAAFHGVQVAFGWIKTAALAVFDWLKSHWPLVLSILGGPIGLAVTLIIKNWGTIRSATATLVGAVSAFFGRIVGAVRGAVSGIVSAVRSIIGVFRSIGSAAGDAFRAVADWFGRIVGAVRGAIGGVVDAVGGIVNAIKSPINAVIGALNNLKIGPITIGGQKVGPVTLPSATFGPYDPFNIPKLAAGGVLTSPTLFLGGEAGTEIVAPEAMLRAIVRDEAPIVGTLNVSAWNPVAVAQQVAAELAYLDVRRSR